jgi:protein involved in polysaccharide export with SLBB domain
MRGQTMKSRYLGAFLFFLLVALCNALATPSLSFAQLQTRNPSKPSGMPADAQKGYNDYVSGKSSSKASADAQRADFERLSDSDKVRFFSSLSGSDKIRFFSGLSDAEKVRLFSNLSEAERARLFSLMSNSDRVMLFSLLNDEDKVRFFSKMSDLDRNALFQNLGNRDKKVIFDSLPEEEKRRWLEQYPELDSLYAGKEIAPRPADRPWLRPPADMDRRRPSHLEQVMSGQFPEDISRDLRQFGYEFFERETPGLQPLASVPVGPDYVIGPDDSFVINLWGKAEGTYEVTVGRDGAIALPRLGTLPVSGLTFAELKQFLLKKFREYYPEFDMSITMGRLRTVDVFVVGEARFPGTYSLSSLSTVVTALAAAGGPTKNGSLRKIQLSRGSGPARNLDLYDFFIRGVRNNDLRLQQGDTIFVPVIGPVVGIAGCVKRPAIYEIKGHESIEDLIDLAGGILPIGHTQNIVIERIKGHERRMVNSFNLDPARLKADPNLKMPVKDFDVVKVFPVHKRVQQVVYLEGHVKYPREYELKPGMKLRDLIPSYDQLLPEPYRPQAEVIRLVPPDLHPEIIPFNLGALLSGDESQNLALQEMDRVIIYDAWEKQQKPEVKIKGSVRSPGTYRLYQGMTIKDLIFQAGNLTDKAFLESATLDRVMAGDKGTDTVKMAFSPRKAMAGVPEDNLLLKKDDVVYIRDIPLYSQALERKVYLEGEFLFPGEYTFSEGERLSSVIQRAQGLTRDAYPFGAVFQRESVRRVQEEQMRRYMDKLEEDILTLSAREAATSLDSTQAAILQQTLAAKRQLLERIRTARPTGRMVINLSEAMALPSSEFNMVLRPGDRLLVNHRPDSVNVMGEVYNPTALLFEQGKTVGDYLEMVGGPMESADSGQMYVVKANGSVISKKQEGYFGLASWDSANKRWSTGGFDSVPLDPGDTVIVPKQVVEYPWLRIVKDITQIAYQIAVAAGVVIAAF